MSSLLYFLAEYYPFWGLPGAFILFEVANHSRRNSRMMVMAGTLFCSFILGALVVGYFWLGGHQAVRSSLQDIEYKYFR